MNIDIDECERESDDCPSNMFCRTTSDGSDTTCGMSSECVNTEGSFQCRCTTGFTGDGRTCTGG